MCYPKPRKAHGRQALCRAQKHIGLRQIDRLFGPTKYGETVVGNSNTLHPKWARQVYFRLIYFLVFSFVAYKNW